MLSQLARLKGILTCCGNRLIMSSEKKGPLNVIMDQVSNEIDALKDNGKHWFAGGMRSVAIAAEFLTRGEVIAVPTDTVYGLAALATDNNAIRRLYEIKKRNENKPIAICVSDISDIKKWGKVEHLPKQLFGELLPGPITIVLERTPELNPALNPGVNNVGIRIPQSNFIRALSEVVGPLALTSANESNTGSTLDPSEFTDLWPKLGAIFYDIPKKIEDIETYRKGSTVVDLTRKDCFTVIRFGVGHNSIMRKLRSYSLRPTAPNKNEHNYK